MRPLIYSAGPDREYGVETNINQANIGSSTDDPTGLKCGDLTMAPTLTYGGKASGQEFRADNITNFDDEAK